MKRYLLIVASLFMAACGGDAYYFWNNTDTDLSVKSDGKTVTIKAGKCEEFENFPS